MNFFTVLFSVFLLLGSAVAEKGKILEYQFGNQITGSRLVVNQDGSMLRQERTCCPPRTQQWSDLTAGPDELLLIERAVEHLPQSGYATFESGYSGPGCSAGDLYVFDGTGKAHLVKGIERGSYEQSPRTVKVNESAAAQEIESFVNRRVTVKMN